jgi:hypothetical protein
MTIAEFIAAVHAEAAKLRFVNQVLLVDQTDYAAKVHLVIRPGLFVQVYANVSSGTRGYALLHRGQRIFGRDCDAHGWHRHPPDNPENHDTSEEGRRTAELADFLREVQDVLEQEQLL